MTWARAAVVLDVLASICLVAGGFLVTGALARWLVALVRWVG